MSLPDLTPHPSLSLDISKWEYNSEVWDKTVYLADGGGMLPMFFCSVYPHKYEDKWRWSIIDYFLDNDFSGATNTVNGAKAVCWKTLLKYVKRLEDYRTMEAQNEPQRNTDRHRRERDRRVAPL